MVLGKVDNNWHQHRECFILIRLQDVEEVVILKEAHRAVGNLQMVSTNRFDNALEKAWDQMLNLFHLAHLKHFLQLRQEQRLLNTVCEGPEFQQAFEERDRQSSVLCQEQH